MGFRTELALQNNTWFLSSLHEVQKHWKWLCWFFPLSSVSHGDHYDITTPVQSKLLCRDWKITAIMGLGRTDNSTAGFEHTQKICQAFLKTQGVTSSIPSQTLSEFQSPPVWTHRTLFIILSRLDGFRGGGSPSPHLQLKIFRSRRLWKWTAELLGELRLALFQCYLHLRRLSGW